MNFEFACNSTYDKIVVSVFGNHLDRCTLYSLMRLRFRTVRSLTVRAKQEVADVF